MLKWFLIAPAPPPAARALPFVFPAPRPGAMAKPGLLYGSSTLTRRKYWLAQLALACGTALEWCVAPSCDRRRGACGEMIRRALVIPSAP